MGHLRFRCSDVLTGGYFRAEQLPTLCSGIRSSLLTAVVSFFSGPPHMTSLLCSLVTVLRNRRRRVRHHQFAIYGLPHNLAALCQEGDETDSDSTGASEPSDRILHPTRPPTSTSSMDVDGTARGGEGPDQPVGIDDLGLFSLMANPIPTTLDAVTTAAAVPLALSLPYTTGAAPWTTAAAEHPRGARSRPPCPETHARQPRASPHWSSSFHPAEGY